MSQGISVPGPTLGVVGGGQLGRMLAEAASPLGVDVIVLDPTPSCPAARVATDQIVADFDDAEAIVRLGERVDALTLEIELADPTGLERAPAPVEPAPSTLAMIKDKLEQMGTFEAAGVPLPPHARVDDADDLRAAIDAFGSPVMLKARTGGYDGRGNVPVREGDDLEAAVEAVGGPAMAERFVDFERELAVIAARGADGVTVHEVTETIHEEEILRETLAPARCEARVAERAQEVARLALEALDGRGVYGIELFEARDGEVLLNEVAPRPHNSGHWTIEGAVTSQFEQHVRAVLGWPLGATDRIHETVVTANLLGDDPRRKARLTGVEAALAAPRAHLHWYGKHEVYRLRKMGHLTVTAGTTDPAGTLDRARELRARLGFATER
ncbi:MAG: 5-(carboxyamino)imidazole ribonucleotide synthase [Halobacteriales archaeon]